MVQHDAIRATINYNRPTKNTCPHHDDTNEYKGRYQKFGEERNKQQSLLPKIKEDMT